MATAKETTPFFKTLQPDSIDTNEFDNESDDGIASVEVATDRKLFGAFFPELPHVTHHRILDRNGDFHQSKGKLFIRKMMKKTLWNNLYSYDWFHSLIDAPTSRVLCLLLIYYVSVISAFAIMYYFISVHYEDCGLGILNFLEAYTFSLQTMATIGFGVSGGDIFFGDCYLVVGVLSVHVIVKTLSEAVIIGVIYSRFSRPMKRATTILFSDCAVIRRIRDRVYFMFQLCELRKHQLTEAHVRLYCVRNERDPEVGGEVAFFQTCSMRLNHPNDELGSGLLLCLPQVVVHEMDSASPMMPPAVWADATKFHRWKQEHLKQRRTGGTSVDKSVLGELNNSVCGSPDEYVPQFPEVVSRSPIPLRRNSSRDNSIDSGVANRGSSRDGFAQSSYQQQTEKMGAKRLPAQMRQDEEQEMISLFLHDRNLEVIAIVEGTDAATGGVVQARHSYTVREMEWNSMFVPCVSQGDDGSAVIDFGKFHSLRSVSHNASHCGAVSSHI